VTGLKNPENLAHLSPDQLAGHLDQAQLATTDSEGVALGRSDLVNTDVPSPPLSDAAQALIQSPAPTRQRLPDRRQTIGLTLAHEGVDYEVDFGLAPDSGTVREIFIDAPPSAAVDRTLIHDAVAIISMALQSGISAASLMSIVGFKLGEPGNGFASILGVALGEAVKLDREPKLF
jgi:hypothetical protein